MLDNRVKLELGLVDPKVKSSRVGIVLKCGVSKPNAMEFGLGSNGVGSLVKFEVTVNPAWSFSSSLSQMHVDVQSVAACVCS